MIMSLLGIAIVALVAYIWMTRGYFSAMLHMCCVLIAGAIAFGLWEPVSYFLLEKGSGNAAIRDSAWAIGLMLPFALSLAIIRPIVDKILPLNAQTESIFNFIGGGVCGTIAGVITAGIVVIGLGSFRMPSDFLGYQSLQIATNGSMKREQRLILPVDRIVAGFYGQLSETSLSTSEPLGKWYPNLADVPAALRMTDGDGNNRNTIGPKDINMFSRYTLGEGRASGSLADLLRDAWGGGSVQQVFDLDGAQYPQNSHIEGFVLQFAPGAREKFGQIVVGNAQARLLVESAAGDRLDLFPIAIASRADAGSLLFGRFRLDSIVHLASPGAGADTRMAFEFIIPPGYSPLALYYKNIRLSLLPVVEKFETVDARDQAILSGSLFGVQADTSVATTRPTTRPVQQDPRDFGIEMTNSIGWTIQKGSERGLQLDGNVVINGEAVFGAKELTDRGGGGAIAQALRVDRFRSTEEASIVKVDVGPSAALSLLGQSFATAQQVVPPYLYDTNGTRYEAVGYVYEDREIIKVRFTPGNPMRGISEIPTALSRSRTDQKLKLVFQVNVGVQINRFTMGDTVVSEFGPFPIVAQRR
jgi:hypothetical protein